MGGVVAAGVGRAAGPVLQYSDDSQTASAAAAITISKANNQYARFIFKPPVALDYRMATCGSQPPEPETRTKK
jgi:hypothetical protein